MSTPLPELQPPAEPLKPCPFCASAARLNPSWDCWWAECKNPACAAEGPVRRAEAEAIACWNKRVPTL